MTRHIRIAAVLGAASLGVTGCVSSPEILSSEENTAFAASLKSDIGAGQEKIVAPISLHEAMARALKYNIDHRVAMMELDLAQNDFKLSGYDMLPQLVANAGYYGRNNQAGASSLSLLSGRQSLEPSTSTERNVSTSDITASWNILDFGLSYMRAKQLGDEALIMEERRRKVIIGIIEDVHAAYWRAVSAERLTKRLALLEQDVKKSFEESRALYQSRQTSPLSALSYQRELLDIKREAQRMHRELKVARMELAALLNIPAGQRFSLEVPEEFVVPGALVMSPKSMMETALANRPEIRESAYAQRIGGREAKIAIMEALPSVNFYAGINTDSNDFLFNNDWQAHGARASWNVIKAFQTPRRRARAKAYQALEEERALAAAVAVVTQVQVSRAQYEALTSEFQTAQRGTEVQSQILQQVETSYSAKATSYQTLVRERMNLLVSEARRDIAYASLQQSLANVYTSLGYDPFASDVTGQEDLKTLAKSMKDLWTARNRKPAAMSQNESKADPKAAPKSISERKGESSKTTGLSQEMTKKKKTS